MSVNDHPALSCGDCSDYLHGRMNVLPEAVLGTACRYEVSASALFLTYMQSVHDRHLAGLPLTATGMGVAA